MKIPNLTEIGKIQRTHGVNGELQVSWSNNFYPEDIKLESVFLLIDGIPIPFFIQTIRNKGNESSLLKFEEIDTIAQAEELIGVKVFTEERSNINQEELFLDDLIGYTVVSQTGLKIGKIEYLHDYSGNLLFEVKTQNSNELPLPASPELIHDIDEETKTLIIEIPDGLTEL